MISKVIPTMFAGVAGSAMLAYLNLGSMALMADEHLCTSREVPAEVTAAALNSQSGDVAVASATGNQVWVLPSRWFESQEVQPIGPLRNVVQPLALTYKRVDDRQFLIAGCFDNTGIVVWDAQSYEARANPAPQCCFAVSLSGSDNPADSWVYVGALLGTTHRLAAIDVAAKRAAWVQASGNSHGSTLESLIPGSVVASSSGTFLYGLDRREQKIRRLRINTPDDPEGIPTLDFAGEAATSSARLPLVPLPFDGGVAHGEFVWSSALDQPPQELPFNARDAVGSRPFLIGLANRDLRVYSLDARELAARSQLPREALSPGVRTIALKSGSQSIQWQARPLVLADAARNRVIVFSKRQALIVRLANWKLPDDPILAAAVDVPSVVTTESEVAMDVRPADPRIQVSLGSAPDGMRLQSGRIVWRPTSEQIGPAKFELHLRFKEATVKKAFELQVVRKSLRASFVATRAALDAEHRRLAVWNSQAPNQLELIDIGTQRVIATRNLATQIVAVALRNDTLCVLCLDREKSKAQLLRLDTQNLGDVKQRAIEIESNVRYLDGAEMEIQDRRLRLRTVGGRHWDYALPDLDLARDPESVIVTKSGVRYLADTSSFVGTQNSLDKANSGGVPTIRSARIMARPSGQRVSGSGSSNASVVCEALLVRLRIQLVPDSSGGVTTVALVAQSLEQAKELHRWPIVVVKTTTLSKDVETFWTVDGKEAAILVQGQVFVLDLSELSELNVPSPLLIQPERNALAVHPAEKARLTYSVTGGTPPLVVHLQFSEPGAAQDAANPHVQRVSNESGHFDVSIAEHLRDSLPHIAKSLAGIPKETTSAEGILSTYVESIGSRFQHITGERLQGVPVAIPVTVFARDARDTRRTFSHVLLVDMPRDQIELELQQAVARRWPGTIIASEALARVISIRGPQPDEALQRLCNALRGNHVANLTWEPDQLERAAKEALAKFDNQWHRTLTESIQHPLRQWTDAEGNRVVARFDRYFAGQVVLSLEKGPALTFALEKLSEADQEIVRRLIAPMNPEQKAQDASRQNRAQMRHIGLAMHNFHDTYRGFPPPVFYSADGKPLLSWRVLLLPFLGGQDLYRLFRLDQPWDSDHNRTLLRFMPAVYDIAGVEAEPYHTPVVRLTGVDTASPLTQQIQYSDLTDGTSNTLVAAVVGKAHAIEWTRPHDLAVTKDDDFGSQLWWLDDNALVLMCDGSVRRVPGSTPSSEWSDAAGRHDSRPLQWKTDGEE